MITQSEFFKSLASYSGDSSNRVLDESKTLQAFESLLLQWHKDKTVYESSLLDSVNSVFTGIRSHLTLPYSTVQNMAIRHFHSKTPGNIPADQVEFDIIQIRKIMDKNCETEWVKLPGKRKRSESQIKKC